MDHLICLCDVLGNGNIITSLWNGTDKTWNSKSLRCFLLCWLNLKCQLPFQICAYGLWMCSWTQQGRWHLDLTLEDESGSASFEAFDKAPIDFRGTALCPIQGDILSEEQCFWKLYIFACLSYIDKTNGLFTCHLLQCVWRRLHLYSPHGGNFNLAVVLWQILMDNILFHKEHTFSVWSYHFWTELSFLLMSKKSPSIGQDLS